MIGIVIVSHSAKLAEGVVELARGMGGADLPIRAAGGLDLPGQPLGTDAMRVLAAIEQVYSEDGVLVLVDLGSAILSTEMALELLPEEKRARVILCAAPLVEGAVAAAVQARLGSSLEQAAAEARAAWAAKAAQFGEQPTVFAASAPPPLSPAQDEAIELRLKVGNLHGLHARPAARLVQTAALFPNARIAVHNLTTGSGPASAVSINALAMLGIRQGHEMGVTISGSDADAALAAIQALAADNFGDREAPAPSSQATPIFEQPDMQVGAGSYLTGIAVSPGIAIGPARLFQPSAPRISADIAADAPAEWAALLAALEKTRAQIRVDRDAALRRAGDDIAAILDAHLLFLDDETLRAPAYQAIFKEQLNAAAAWQRAVAQVAAGYRRLDDPYLQTRAVDVAEVGRQVIACLLGDQPLMASTVSPGILIAANLSLADTARLDPAVTQGIVTVFGSATSHSAILARSVGIPMVAGLGETILKLVDGATLIVDGELGQVWIDPPEAIFTQYSLRSQAGQATRVAELAASAAPAVTRDGRRVEVAANIASVAEARAAAACGAEGVGVFRTEFLFLDRRSPPDEEEQYAAYCAAAEALGGRSLIIRTLDAGGDKPISYLNLAVEANPFLGVRAIRLCLAEPGLFKTQLRAILRAAATFPVKVMFPMIAALEEWREAVNLLAEARDEVQHNGFTVPARIETGIMVEIPAAALCAAQFAGEVDFFSIGTNDLTQYTLAAERGNPRLAALSDAFHPAVLQLIQRVVEAAHERGKWAGVCGEMAGDPLAAPVLVGLGIDELSMNAPFIPRIKQIVRSLEYNSLRTAVQPLLSLETAQAVRTAASLLQPAGRS